LAVVAVAEGGNGFSRRSRAREELSSLREGKKNAPSSNKKDVDESQKNESNLRAGGEKKKKARKRRKSRPTTAGCACNLDRTYESGRSIEEKDG